ncbi:BldC family transcriptional regulator [Cellulomonas denverensis]|uniref:BldC family transcriptional regulator n=2 Tax=Cellulomonas denverensis TaxID=264297 RepID=A0A7X6QZP0_9CELL|nr:BldC family transcriptional regulator [Cellulomonas denverensis]NKY23408.1 BldC family transcriptional regulator [Cellulomonas denverensis]
MTPAEVAAVFGVQAKTVAAWARAGRLDAVRTLGGHRRYRRSDVEQLLGPRSMVPRSDTAVPTQRTQGD